MEGAGRLQEACGAYTQALALQKEPAAAAPAQAGGFQTASLLPAIRSRLAMAKAAGGSAPAQAGSSALPYATADSIGAGSSSALALGASHAQTQLASPAPPLNFDVGMMSAFLSDPQVLATASSVADSFMEGAPHACMCAAASPSPFHHAPPSHATCPLLCPLPWCSVCSPRTNVRLPTPASACQRLPAPPCFPPSVCKPPCTLAHIAPDFNRPTPTPRHA